MIFDEATSALDKKMKKEFFNQLTNLLNQEKYNHYFS